MLAAYLIAPARRTYDLHELAADAGLAAAKAADDDGDGQLSLDGEPPADPAVDARLTWELSDRQRPRIAELGLESLLTDVEMPLIEVLAAMERIGLKLDAERLAAINDGMAD